MASKQQQKQIAAFVKAGKTAQAQRVILDALARTTGGAAADSVGKYGDAINMLGDASEDAKKALAEKITSRYHGPEAGPAARADWDTRFSKKDLAAAELPPCCRRHPALPPPPPPCCHYRQAAAATTAAMLPPPPPPPR